MAATAVAQLNPEAVEFMMPSHSFNPDAPEFKPIEAILRAEATEFFPMPPSWWNTLQASNEAHQNNRDVQNKQKRQMPFATDQEWEQRIQKREKEVDTIKSLQSYRLYIEVFPPESRSEDDPKTPDPRDRTVSKRMWKWNVEKWRLQLKSRCVYSRAVLLQCREVLSKQPNGEVGEEVAATEERVTLGAVEEAPLAKWRAEPADRFLATVNSQDQSRAIVSGAPGLEKVGPKATSRAGSFQ
eukprot:CAMPEP_0169124248 /NCGR_PEP_ID=MMETSP1015-20121227/34221_1 /TAXON_ID=342587 /ORGANISM="Karlodinium micrum, Strain CCMP2283" /LENGTH=240 /DNA_ID=CAMNT_0009187647 /DNA_START=71 /DNA_END=793 /DNA_ORIENTATION=-